MSGKELDRQRAQSALAIVALGAVWWLAGTGWAVLLLVAVVAAGGAALLRKR
jgi:hypothetical protein